MVVSTMAVQVAPLVRARQSWLNQSAVADDLEGVVTLRSSVEFADYGADADCGQVRPSCSTLTNWYSGPGGKRLPFGPFFYRPVIGQP
jgi:hypothetical protein